MGLFTHKNSTYRTNEQPPGKPVAVVLFIMDSYVTMALGLPRTLRDVDPTYIMPEPAPNDMRTPSNVTQMHARLARILGEMIESSHPPLKHKHQSRGFYAVESSMVDRAEGELDKWFAQLTHLTTESDIGNDETVLRFVI